MSALDVFRSRIVESAKVAANAAKTGFSLDDLAKNDEYIHSEGLRISDRKKKNAPSSASNGEVPSVVEDLSGKFVDALTMAARQPADIEQKQSSPRIDNPRKQTQYKPQLIPSVAALYDQNEKQHAVLKQSAIDGRQNNMTCTNKGQAKLDTEKNAAANPSSPPTKSILLVNERQAHILTELDYDSDTDSDEDEFSPLKSINDIELGRDNTALYDQLENELNQSISRQTLLNGQTKDADKVKGVNRFMEMTTRLENEKSQTVHKSTPNYRIDDRNITANDENIKDVLKVGLAWVRNVAAPQLEAVSKQILTRISEPELRNKSTPDHPSIRGRVNGPQHPLRRDSNDDIMTSTSTSVLSANDMAELERIRMRSSTSKIQLLTKACIDNYRFVFIGLTLVIALFVYFHFYSRHKSVNNVL
jgi:hypothetical protein